MHSSLPHATCSDPSHRHINRHSLTQRVRLPPNKSPVLVTSHTSLTHHTLSLSPHVSLIDQRDERELVNRLERGELPGELRARALRPTLDGVRLRAAIAKGPGAESKPRAAYSSELRPGLEFMLSAFSAFSRA